MDVAAVDELEGLMDIGALNEFGRIREQTGLEQVLCCEPIGRDGWVCDGECFIS